MDWQWSARDSPDGPETALGRAAAMTLDRCGDKGHTPPMRIDSPDASPRPKRPPRWPRWSCLACLLLIALAGPACSDNVAPRTGRISVVTYDKWQVVPRAGDPWAVRLTADDTCSEAAIDTKRQALEIDTDYCPWVTVRQPLQTEIRQGETVRFIFMHTYLFSEPPARAVAELRIGGERYWQMDVAMPQHEAVHKPTWKAAREVAAGTLVEFHVHNHGDNSYAFIDLTTGD